VQVEQRKGPSGANAPPVHGIKKCLEFPGISIAIPDVSYVFYIIITSVHQKF
jgi:hypothetical protein